MTWTSLENTKLRGRIQAQSRIAWFRVQGMFRTGESAETGRRSVVPPGLDGAGGAVFSGSGVSSGVMTMFWD